MMEPPLECESCLALLDQPGSLLPLEQQQALSTHLAGCPSCRQLVSRVEEELEAYRAGVDPEPTEAGLEALLERVRADRAAMNSSSLTAAPSSQPGSSPPPFPARLEPHARASRWSRAARYAAPAVALAAALLLFLRPGHPIRFKGPTDLEHPFSLDLQASIERGGSRRLERAKDEAVLGSGDGVLFRFQVEGGPHLLLIERDPAHRLRVLFERHDLPRLEPGPTVLDVTSRVGRPLRYEPDGPAGEYTWLAVLSDQPFAADAPTLDRLWTRYVDQLLESEDTPAEAGLRIDALRLRYHPDGALPAPAASSPTEREAP